MRSAEQFADTTERMGHDLPVFFTFAVDQPWLIRHADALVTRMARFPLPVAFVPSANYDLFGTRKAVVAPYRVQTGASDDRPMGVTPTSPASATTLSSPALSSTTSTQGNAHPRATSASPLGLGTARIWLLLSYWALERGSVSLSTNVRPVPSGP